MANTRNNIECVLSIPVWEEPGILLNTGSRKCILQWGFSFFMLGLPGYDIIMTVSGDFQHHQQSPPAPGGLYRSEICHCSIPKMGADVRRVGSFGICLCIRSRSDAAWNKQVSVGLIMPSSAVTFH